MAKKELIRITTLNEFIEWVERLKEQVEQSNLGKCLFRGLSNKEYSIEASAWRRLKHEADKNNLGIFLEINRDIIDDARLYEYDRDEGEKLSDLEILAKLQHFRAATCLVDFTYSAQVALWFACQSSYKKAPNSEELANGKVNVVFDNTSRIEQITPDLLNEEISHFFETNEGGISPLYQWQPRRLIHRIFPQYSVFLFGADRIIEPDEYCIIVASSKQKILASLEDFSQITEATLYPDFEGFVYQRTQERPYNVPDYKQRGYRAYQDGRYEEAIAYYDEVITRNPDDVDTYKLRGDAKVHLGQYAGAITDYDEVISVDLDNLAAYQAKGAIYFDLNLYEPAIDAFDRVIELDPDNGNSYKLRGSAKLSLNRLIEARGDFLTALEFAQQTGDTLLIASIEPALRDINSRIAEGEHWTPERFEKLVPESLRDIYEVQNRDKELYSLGADLQALIQEQGWELTLRFGVKTIFFSAEDKRLFGINLYSSRPRLTFCSVSKEEARVIVPQCDFTSYPQYSQLVCQRGPSVEDLRPLFEFVYRKHIVRLWEDQEIVDPLKRILENYDYLEYDEASSKRTNGLRVKVTCLDADRDFSVTRHICRALEQATGRPFFVPGAVTHGSQNWEKEWTFFTVHEWKL